MPTLAEVRTLFSRYGGANNSFVDRLNQVVARLLPEGNWRGTKVPARFVVYEDAQANQVVTLPRQLETILAGAYQASTDADSPGMFWCGEPIPVRNGWYEFAASGPGNYAGSDACRGIIPLNGRFTTFADWTTPLRLRIKLEQTEIAAKIIFRGTLGGDKIFTADGANFIEGVALSYSNATVTTVQTFDAPPYEIIKPVTRGRIKLYAVNADEGETLVGWYEPTETTPSYRRFKVPVCPAGELVITPAQFIAPAAPAATALVVSPAFVTICKKAFVALVNDYDELLIANFGALRHGLEALLKEDASDHVRADQLWAMAKHLLIQEQENEVGAGAQGFVQMQDDYDMASVGGESCGGGWHGWP